MPLIIRKNLNAGKVILIVKNTSMCKESLQDKNLPSRLHLQAFFKICKKTCI